jgi:hypothetical protein
VEAFQVSVIVLTVTELALRPPGTLGGAVTGEVVAVTPPEGADTFAGCARSNAATWYW